jgi:non-canonical poly(A) RNA polymerase PAPD5/7
MNCDTLPISCSPSLAFSPHRLHDELMAFADWISPTQREHETRKMVIELIRRAIVKQWPDAEVHAFGSQNTQLYMPQG